MFGQAVWIPAPRLREDRLRGNDINCIFAVIPAKAGMKVRTAPPGTPSSVIPAKAGIHGFSDQCSSQTRKPNTDEYTRAGVGRPGVAGRGARVYSLNLPNVGDARKRTTGLPLLLLAPMVLKVTRQYLESMGNRSRIRTRMPRPGEQWRAAAPR